MKEIVYELLAILLCGEQQEKRYILDNVKPEYFEYEALSELFNVVKELDGSHAPIDMVSVREALIKDKDPEVQGRRIRAFCSFFMAISGAERKLCDEEVRSQISVFIATICGKMTYSTPVEYVTKTFIGDYVGRARKEILTEYSRKLRIRHKELVRKLVGNVFTFGGKNISERTARNYISALSGTFLICNEDGTYSLANPNLEIEYGKERDDGN